MDKLLSIDQVFTQEREDSGFSVNSEPDEGLTCRVKKRKQLGSLRSSVVLKTNTNRERALILRAASGNDALWEKHHKVLKALVSDRKEM